MLADWVKCCNCDFIGFITVGAYYCPKCETTGHLSWVDENKQTIDVPESQIQKPKDALKRKIDNFPD